MRYRFFLFKSSLYDKGIVTTSQINALAEALSSYCLEQIRVFQCMDYDLEKPMYDLYYSLGDKAQANMQVITQRHSCGCWIDVTTDFPHAEEVYPIVSKTAKDHGLIVYDAEKRQFTTDAEADK
ncbi:MAG: hypothetical protein IKX19_11695, partial [Clostridia bacterium]|nr:hypothetical protein [Clostridia bacterium]